MPHRKSPTIDRHFESWLTWLFAGLVLGSSLLGLLGLFLH
jgi:hypothetical protein